MTGKDVVAVLMQAQLDEIFNQRDDVVRREAMERLYVEDVVFTDPDGTALGIDAVEDKIGGLVRKAPESFVFTPDGPVYSLHEALSGLAWTLGPEGGPATLRGLDVVTVSDGRITSVQTLLAH
jgi:hypothetical protein